MPIMIAPTAMQKMAHPEGKAFSWNEAFENNHQRGFMIRLGSFVCEFKSYYRSRLIAEKPSV